MFQNTLKRSEAYLGIWSHSIMAEDVELLASIKIPMTNYHHLRQLFFPKPEDSDIGIFSIDPQ